MKKAKSLAKQSQKRQNGVPHAKRLSFYIDKVKTLNVLSKASVMQVMEAKAGIQLLITEHNHLLDSMKNLTQGEKHIMNAALLLIEQVVDTRIDSFNALIDKKFTAYDARKNAKKKSFKPRKKTSKKVPRRKRG